MSDSWAGRFNPTEKEAVWYQNRFDCFGDKNYLKILGLEPETVELRAYSLFRLRPFSCNTVLYCIFIPQIQTVTKTTEYIIRQKNTV
jgi:hypothetical protein